VGDAWAAFSVPLEGHIYQAMAVHRPALWGVSPFRQLANGIGGAGTDMADWTIAVAGARLGDGDGFILLAMHDDLATGNYGSAEELQDHDCTAAP
jgi:CDP-diacylglycerol pyrophosphatase